MRKSVPWKVHCILSCGRIFNIKGKITEVLNRGGDQGGIGEISLGWVCERLEGDAFCPKTMLSCSKVTNGVLYTLSRKEEEATHIMSTKWFT